MVVEGVVGRYMRYPWPVLCMVDWCRMLVVAWKVSAVPVTCSYLLVVEMVTRSGSGWKLFASSKWIDKQSNQKHQKWKLCGVVEIVRIRSCDLM